MYFTPINILKSKLVPMSKFTFLCLSYLLQILISRAIRDHSAPSKHQTFTSGSLKVNRCASSIDYGYLKSNWCSHSSNTSCQR